MNTKRIAYRFCLSAATGLLGTVATLAQAPSAPQQPSMPQAPSNSSATTPGNQPGSGAYPGTAPTGQDYATNAFVSKAMEGDLAEVALGQLAEQKSQSNDVKQYAQKMVSEHGQMNDKWFKPVAQQLGISEPKGPSKKDKKELAKLEQLSGQDFDREYLTMMIRDHQQDLKDFKTEAEVAQNPNVKQVATQGANVIQQHLQLAEQIARNHNIDTGESAKSSM